jgi:hypothetical protein
MVTRKGGYSPPYLFVSSLRMGWSLRLGVFVQVLGTWAEWPCVLTIRIPATGSELAVGGILRAYYSLTSVRGWALVPPEQHGGFGAARMTELELEHATEREVIEDAGGRRLRYRRDDDAVFELMRDASLFTGPPRHTRTGRYLYVGGRRRRAPEPWMLE